ncbi:hypothetical protein [Streptomyces sp. NPDC127072]|uniref:hypothetical protein n=1 Tax=Streptomyces sp. NPDC127072 TaxID=3347129 RepID=UPI00364DF54C
MNMIEEHENDTGEEAHPNVRTELPVDTGIIQKAIDEVSATRLDVPPRDVIDQHTDELTEYARRLLREDHPAGQQDNPCVRAVFRALYRLLDTRLRPTPVTSDYTAWTYSRSLADATHAVLDSRRQHQVP